MTIYKAGTNKKNVAGGGTGRGEDEKKTSHISFPKGTSHQQPKKKSQNTRLEFQHKISLLVVSTRRRGGGGRRARWLVAHSNIQVR
jgi:hypothetical protein